MEPILKEVGAKRFIRLKVSGAFHSRYMKAAQEEFKSFVKKITFRKPMIPVISNFTSLPYSHQDMAETLTNRISNPVRWEQSVQYLLNQGEAEFVEVGPGKVLTGLVRQIKRAAAKSIAAKPVCV